MISIKSQKELESMRRGGKILAEIMRKLEKEIVSGKSTQTLNNLAEEFISASGGLAAFKGYKIEESNPFPATICASLNDEVVHGVPSEEILLKNGDLLKIDIGMKYEGMFVDIARSFIIGNADKKKHQLIKITEQAFWEGVKQIKNGKKISDYSKAVQKFVEKNGFSVVKNLVGHGIGKQLHEDPQIPNYYSRKSQDIVLFENMTLALEPIINIGRHEIILSRDGWTFKTLDGSFSAHYENTVIVGKNEAEVITL